MNAPLIIANLLTLIVCFGHSIMGDKELRVIAPNQGMDQFNNKLEKWIHARAHLFIISVDYLMATIGLALINFSDLLDNEPLLLRILATYFLFYAVAFFFSVLI